MINIRTLISFIDFNFKVLVRNIKSTGIMFVLPVVFMGVFALAFGGDSNGISIEIGIYNLEENISESVDLVAIFTEISEENENISFVISRFDNLDAMKLDLESGDIDIGINTSISSSGLSNFEIIADINNQSRSVHESVVKDILLDIAVPEDILSSISTEIIGVDEESDVTGFTVLAPGLIIYGLLILIPGISQSFTELAEKKYLVRFAISKVNAAEIILGNLIFYILVGIIQLFLLYATSILFGYDPAGNIIFAVIPAILTLIFVVGLGLLIGSFTKNTQAATNIGTIISIIFGFLSGSFISGIGGALEFEILDRSFEFNDFIPTKWSTVAMENILTYESNIGDLSTELLIIAISGLSTIIIGIFLYNRNQLKSELS